MYTYSLRRKAEEECAAHRQRADELASDCRAYKLRLKAAAAAYAEVKTMLKRVQDDLGEVAKVESHPKLEGRQMIMVVAPR